MKSKGLYTKSYHLISRDIMEISKYELEIKHHAFIQAMQRGISPDLIEQAILKGSIQRYGKHGVKFICQGSKRTKKLKKKGSELNKKIYFVFWMVLKY